MKNLSIIVAMAENNVIGINNTLPWHLPEDLKRFRALTTGHHIIMGRKTYESLGRLLPGRTTVIVTRNKNYHVEGAMIANSLESAVELCKDDDEPFLIGGAELYAAGITLSNKLYLTKVNTTVEGDAFFPSFHVNDWELSEKKDHIAMSGLEYSDLIYIKK
ncbi:MULTISPECIES: dihydrofolate reductase [Methylotenera]|uniref:dihydrofolate reductase n=1 Tax=Methylotenera TaxID=359407 RepID=UPI00037DC468|nr:MULTISPECIES: dihydrofolate reductase [Methylotenera]